MCISADSLTIDPSKLRRTASLLADLLAQRDYRAFCSLAETSRLTPEDVERVIRSYGRCLIPLPPVAADMMDVVPIRGTDPQEWNVIVPLWTNEEGRSDLSLDITLKEAAAQAYLVEINDLRVR